VARVIEYIFSGDVFQVNLAQRLISPQRCGDIEFYHRLRSRNPAPFAGFLDLGEFSLASASPERFLQLMGDQVQTRPIKGTRPRGGTPEEDRRFRKELRESEKDQAENVMIVDLLRNDLSRVCRPHSVKVPSLFEVETYETVHHLVSEVQGRLRRGQGPVDLLRAAFPGGSITGAPKVRAMEIIAELETAARGAYCGSMAYVGFDGSMDSSILIRTATLGRGWLQFPVGGGITARSSPAGEYSETLDKAAGMLRALE
jgi:para-aminobenzoate synthetase component 1